jgi:uncharacterized membrane protein YhaH (DUF805 family)
MGELMKWFYFFRSLDGRISRQGFWLWMFGTAAVSLVIAFVIALAAVLFAPPSFFDGWRGDLFGLTFLYPQFVIFVKRGHDRNIPLWVIGACYALAAVHELLIRFGWLVSWPEQNAFSPLHLSSYIVIMFVGIFWLALLIELGFRRGTVGPNQFGPDPLANR